MKWACSILLILAALTGAPAFAWLGTVQASLDRDRIELGETVVLTVQVRDTDPGMPDWSPLEPEFGLSGHASRRQRVHEGGVAFEQATYTVALQPRTAGELEIPGIRVGDAVTAPLRLFVTAAVERHDRGQEPVFIEIEAGQGPAYVQQDIGYVLKLHYAVPLYSGQIDVPEPAGTRWQRAGGDLEYQRDIEGRRYSVLERRYVFTPERSGPLRISAPTFSGRSLGMHSSTGARKLQAVGDVVEFDIQPIPDGASRPWRPLHDLRLAYLETPASPLRAGEPIELEIEAIVDGSSQAAPDVLDLPSIPGTQMFSAAAQSEQRFEQGRPQVRLTRRFTLVPGDAGELRIPGLELHWWNVTTGSEASARLQDLVLQIGPAAGAAVAQPESAAGAPDPQPGRSSGVLPWIVATCALALLWLATVGLLLRRRGGRRPLAAAAGGIEDARPVAAAITARQLRQVLDTGDAAEVAEALCAMAAPPVADIDELRQRLAAPDQVAAVDALQRARWAGGSMADAREKLRVAFRNGARWKAGTAVAPERRPALPPLYPEA